jgi:rSAM/selenodomain-associated transferase 1
MQQEKLIVFVKAPRPGTVKTRLARTIGPEAACAAYQCLVLTLLRQLQPLPALELCFSPDDAASEVHAWLRKGWESGPQGPGDLGHRLCGAFSRAFACGSRRVVVLGSDCPTVTVEDLRHAWNHLRQRDVVLGPAADGGYWLIGLRQPQPDLFREIPWSSERVLEETLNRCRRARLTVELLRRQSDVDTVEDWNGFLAAQNAGGKNA